MKKTLILFIVSLALLFSVNANAQFCNAKMNFVLQEHTVNLISIKYNTETEQFGYGSCTGVVVDKDETGTGILTAKHCTRKSLKIIVDGEFTVTKVVQSPDVDLAYVRIEESLFGKNKVKILKSNARMFTCVYSLGDYLTYQWSSSGIIIAVSDKKAYTRLKVKRGCSGGGVINSRGYLVGILVDGNFRGEEDEVSFEAGFVNSSEIQKFLKTIR